MNACRRSSFVGRLECKKVLSETAKGVRGMISWDFYLEVYRNGAIYFATNGDVIMSVAGCSTWHFFFLSKLFINSSGAC